MVAISPICVFTNNVGRRSPEKLEERAARWWTRSGGSKARKWWAQGLQEGCWAHTQDADPQQGQQSRPRGDIPAAPRDWTADAGDQPRMGRQSGEKGAVGESCQDGVDRWRARDSQGSSATWNSGHAARSGGRWKQWGNSESNVWSAAAAIVETRVRLRAAAWIQAEKQAAMTPCESFRSTLSGAGEVSLPPRVADGDPWKFWHAERRCY